MTLASILRSGILEVLDYLSAHVLTCLVPAFFIAGGIAVFVSGTSVLRYFGPQTKKYLAYSVASVSGVILAVCSCTILPLFAGIYRKGAGLGPAITFLYSGPAINLLAIVLTARKLGWNLGAGRAVGAVVFSIVIGLIMAYIYRREERDKVARALNLPGSGGKPAIHSLAFFAVLVAILLVGTARIGTVPKLFGLAVLLAILGAILAKWFSRQEVTSWLGEKSHRWSERSCISLH